MSDHRQRHLSKLSRLSGWTEDSKNLLEDQPVTGLSLDGFNIYRRSDNKFGLKAIRAINKRSG